MSSRSARQKRRLAKRRQSRWAAFIVFLSAVFVTGSFFRHSEAVVVGALPPSAQALAAPAPSQENTAIGRQPDSIPTSGPGTFLIGKTSGAVLGTAGNLKRFRVAVESNLPGELDELMRTADSTLGDPRSWIAGKQTSFQRVADGQPYDFTIYLVTRDTAYKMCLTSGLDIRMDDIPFTSCQQTRRVILNLDRWHLSVPEYVEAEVPLENYRQYMINHEVGHELGRGHEKCPGEGQLAPVMAQQTLRLDGCTANAWPYLDGKRYTGPSVP